MPSPDAAIAAPATPPIRAWLELVGSPSRQLVRFHARPEEAGHDHAERHGARVHDPLADGRGHLERDEGAGEVRTAAAATATFGRIALVAMLVATALAESWDPAAVDTDVKRGPLGAGNRPDGRARRHAPGCPRRRGPRR